MYLTNIVVDGCIFLGVHKIQNVCVKKKEWDSGGFSSKCLNKLKLFISIIVFLIICINNNNNNIKIAYSYQYLFLLTFKHIFSKEF